MEAASRSRAAGSGISKEKVEKLNPGRTSKLWASFWELADEDGEHFIWRGPVDKGTPLFVPAKGPPLHAAHVAWTYYYRELGADESLEPSCRRKLCVRADHQAVRSRR